MRKSKLYIDTNSPLYILEELSDVKTDKELLKVSCENKLIEKNQEVILNKFLNNITLNSVEMNQLAFLHLKCNIPLVASAFSVPKGLTGTSFLEIWMNYHRGEYLPPLECKRRYYRHLGNSVGYFQYDNLAEFITKNIKCKHNLNSYFEGLTQAGFINYIYNHPFKIRENAYNLLKILCETDQFQAAKRLYEKLGYINITTCNEEIFAGGLQFRFFAYCQMAIKTKTRNKD